MRPGYDESPLNPVPAVIWVLVLPMIAFEAYFGLGQLGFIGGGQMAETMIRGILAGGLASPAKILVAEPNPARCDMLSQQYAVGCTADPQTLCSRCQVIVVAIKPQMATTVLSAYRPFMEDDHLVISIMAGVTLAGLARETSTIRLGTMVTSATFRYPGPLAIAVAQVDEMSGGRVELGLGAGWFAEEHEAYAIPFPALGERFDRLEEQLQIITGFWDTPVGEHFDFAGKHYTVKNSPALPKPAQAHPPVIIGGGGAKRTPALAARFAGRDGEKKIESPFFHRTIKR